MMPPEIKGVFYFEASIFFFCCRAMGRIHANKLVAMVAASTSQLLTLMGCAIYSNCSCHVSGTFPNKARFKLSAMYYDTDHSKFKTIYSRTVVEHDGITELIQKFNCTQNHFKARERFSVINKILIW